MVETPHHDVQECVEVRIPTYKRVQMLSSCLNSLLQQTWQHWRGLIFDDNADPEVRDLVASKQDSRLLYVANETRLGAAGNLNQCFKTTPILGEAYYACCLEDDNWLYPHALESNIAILRESGASLLMRNQDIFQRHNLNVTPTTRTTLGHWFESDGHYTPLDLAARSIFYTGVSNGALFWRTDARSQLMDPFQVRDPSIQEYVRCWQIQEPVYVCLDTAAAYSEPIQPTLRYYTKDKSFSRTLQYAHGCLLKYYGLAFADKAFELGHQFGDPLKVVRCFSNIATPRALLVLHERGGSLDLSLLLRGLVKKIWVKPLISKTTTTERLTATSPLPFAPRQAAAMGR